MRLGLLGEDHGGIGGEIAERGVLGRLHHEARRIERRRQAAGGLDLVENGGDDRVEVGENVHR